MSCSPDDCATPDSRALQDRVNHTVNDPAGDVRYYLNRRRIMISNFCFVTEPIWHGDKKFYFDRKTRLEKFINPSFHPNFSKDICERFGLDWQNSNCYYYCFDTQKFRVEFIHSTIDDRVSAEEWARGVDYIGILGHYKRLYFTKTTDEIYHVSLRFLEKNRIKYSIIKNPYPFDESENYIIDFEDDQTELFYMLGSYLFDETIPKNAIRFFLYGFDVFNIIRYCNQNENRAPITHIWNSSQKEAVDTAVGHLMDYYNVSIKFDLYPHLLEDIVKRYRIPHEYGELRFFSSRNQEQEKYMKDIEHEMVLDHKMPTRWKSEQEMFRIIHQMFPDAIFHYENKGWLGDQHLDVYVPSKNLAFEYQGRQHFKSIAFFGGEDDFNYLSALDSNKRKLCEQNNVRLIEWSFADPLTTEVLKNKLINYSGQIPLFPSM